MAFKGIIFDLDGTLVNSLEDIADAMNHVLALHLLPVHDVEAYRTFVGNGMRKLAERALPEEMRKNDVCEAYFKEMFDYYGAHCTIKSKAYEGIPELIQALTQQSVPIAVLSNKAHDLTQKVVSAIFSPDAFLTVVGLKDEATKKPNPAAAIQICEQMGGAPEDFMFVGDSDVDMQTARNAGMYGVGVTWGFRSRAELEAAGAKAIIDAPMELTMVLAD